MNFNTNKKQKGSTLMDWKKLGILTLGTITLASSHIGCNWVTQKNISEMDKAVILDVGGDCVPIYKKYADLGDAEAQANLAMWYMNERQFRCVNMELAGKYAELSAKQNHPFGLYCYGLYLQYFAPFPEHQENNDREVEACYLKAVEAGYDTALLTLAELYELKRMSGDSPLHNLELAEKYYRMAFEKKVPYAASSYGIFLERNNRPEEAIKIYQTSEDYFSLSFLASNYYFSKGGAQNFEKAVELAKKALEKGRPKANKDNHFIYLGAEYSSGILYYAALEKLALDSEDKEGIELLRMAADESRGYPQLTDVLYTYGLYLVKKQDYRQADKYLEEAANQNNPHAQILLGDLCMKDNDIDGAIKYYNMATAFPKFRDYALTKLAGIYYDRNDIGMAKFYNNILLDYENVVGYNNSALIKLIYQRTSDNDIADAAALYAWSLIGENEIAANMFKQIMEKDGELLRKLADNGNSNALWALGVYEVWQSERDQMSEKACVDLQKAIELKNKYACYVRGNEYEQGLDGFEVDILKAIEHYKMSGEQNFVPAISNLVNLVAENYETVKMPWDEIEKWIKKVVFLPISYNSKLWIDLAYLAEIVGKDDEMVETILETAVEQGNEYAMLYQHRRYAAKNDEQQADYYLESALKSECPIAFMLKADQLREEGDFAKMVEKYLECYNLYQDGFSAAKLAECYLNGQGRSKNAEKFLAFAELACQKDELLGFKLLGDAYRDGNLVEKDLEKSKKYYEQGSQIDSEKWQSLLQESEQK
ncbi:MAG: SEL1-like repeat protein [Lentisphaeria bacterium]|nr:SEL1-like repeat protein [Lentisphaeria bacterium]